MKKLEGKVALITGASSGIGRATVIELAHQGALVVALGRSLLPLKSLVEQINNGNGTATYITADVTKPEQVQTAITEVIAQHGHLDIVVSNAGVEDLDPVMKMDVEEVRQMMEVNFFGSLNVFQAVLPHLIECQSGSIVQVSSPMSYLTFPYMGGYSASKAACTAMVGSLRREVASLGIHVMVCYPGHTDTGLVKHIKPERLPPWHGKGVKSLTPELVAEKLVAGILNGKKQVFIGGPIQLLLSVNRFAPSLADKIIHKVTASV